MPIKLHRCSNMWVKVDGHPCWRVQKALDAAGTEYEVVKGPFRKSSRDQLEQLSGQRQYPVIEFEDGSIYRENSKDMAATIAARALDSKRSPSLGELAAASPFSRSSASALPDLPRSRPMPLRIQSRFVNCISSYCTIWTKLPHGSWKSSPRPGSDSTPAASSARRAASLSSTTNPKWRACGPAAASGPASTR